MNEQDETARSALDAKQALARADMQDDPSYYEAPEIQGWALQWDTTTLRRANLARKMRSLRKASRDK